MWAGEALLLPGVAQEKRPTYKVVYFKISSMAPYISWLEETTSLRLKGQLNVVLENKRVNEFILRNKVKIYHPSPFLPCWKNVLKHYGKRVPSAVQRNGDRIF